jgi:hypothetical protein
MNDLSFKGPYVVITHSPLDGEGTPKYFLNKTTIQSVGTIEEMIGGFEFKNTEPSTVLRLRYDEVKQIQTVDSPPTILWPVKSQSVPLPAPIKEMKQQKKPLVRRPARRVPSTSNKISTSTHIKETKVVDPEKVGTEYQGKYSIKFKKFPSSLPISLKDQLVRGIIGNLFGKVTIHSLTICFTYGEENTFGVDKTDIEMIWDAAGAELWKNSQPLRQPFNWSMRKNK